MSKVRVIAAFTIDTEVNNPGETFTKDDVAEIVQNAWFDPASCEVFGLTDVQVTATEIE